VTAPPGGEIAGRLARITGTGVREVRPAGSGHGQRHYRAVLDGGQVAFVKAAGSGSGPGPLRAEALGLRWLAEPGVAAVPGVLGFDDSLLAVSWLDAATPDEPVAERAGAALAHLHAAGAARFGTPWPGFIASLPLPAEPGEPADGWPAWYATQRVLPFVRLAVDAGTLAGADARVLEAAAARFAAVAGPPEPPSRIHGDLWSGNLLWSGGRGWLIDPAAQGGHRETDLAMLALFGAPYLERIMTGYQQVAPLAAGWRQRVPMHQLHPLLVHACLFGASYRSPTLDAARAVLAL
jgi:fructosamine-3-kinase